MTTTTITIDHNKSVDENLHTIVDALANDPNRKARAKAYGEKLDKMSYREYLDTLDPFERELVEYEMQQEKQVA